MNPSQRQSDYNPPSRLSYYPGCNTPISGRLWDRHIETLRTLGRQATALGLFEIAYEFSMLIGAHVAGQLRYELGDKP
jgi:hypothetical protein